MILGVGTDIVDARRIALAIKRHSGRFESRIFTTDERLAAQACSNPALYFAKRFAAKEAVYKALNASRLAGLGWREVETLNDSSGAPLVKLSGQCKTALETITPVGYNSALFVSLSDEPPYTLAFVVINAVPMDWTLTHE